MSAFSNFLALKFLQRYSPWNRLHTTTFAITVKSHVDTFLTVLSVGKFIDITAIHGSYVSQMTILVAGEAGKISLQMRRTY